VECVKISLAEIIEERGKTSKELLLCTSEHFFIGTPEQLIELIFKLSIAKGDVEALMDA
jgi:hypothetical protein